MAITTPSHSASLDVPATAYPNQREAAEILGIAQSTLARRRLPAELAGNRDKRYRPRVLVQEAAFQRRRPLSAVVAALIAYAREHAPDAETAVREEAETAARAHRFDERLLVPAILRDARAVLPDPLFDRVKRIFDELEPLPFAPDPALTDDDVAEWERAVASGDIARIEAAEAGAAS